MEGTAVFSLRWMGEWPVDTATPMAMFHAGDSTVSLTALPEGTINVDVVGKGGEQAQITSIPLTLRSKIIKVGVAWRLPEHLSVFANGIQIASLIPGGLPRSADLPIPAPRKATDFGAANTDAVKQRHQQELNRTARPGHRLRSHDEEVRFLDAANMQLRELSKVIENGSYHHFHGAIALIRSLVARGRSSNFQPLLQRVAGRLGLPLILYAGLYDDDPIVNACPPLDIRLDVVPRREIGDEAEIDLDVWLQTPGLVRDTGLVLSQNDVIRLLSDTAGSHFDPDASPEFDDVEGITLYRGGLAAPITVAYTSQLAKCLCFLIDRLLEAAAGPP